jgi:Phosphotransferase enzyme family
MVDYQDSTGEETIPLKGGRTHTAVLKVGSTVRRPTGSWTPGVHALLHHLEERGYGGAPCVLGIDSQGREVLTYVSGRVVWPDNFYLVGADEALQSIAHRVRWYHDVVADFDGAGYDWSERSRDSSRNAEVLCHNDLAAWNLVLSADGWVFIDWDLAAPGRRAWDVAWALISLVPFTPDGGLDDERVGKRIRVFCEAYGLDHLSRDIVHIAYQRAAQEAKRICLRGGAGEPPYARLLAEGHLEVWSALERHIFRHVEVWTTAAFGVD